MLTDQKSEIIIYQNQQGKIKIDVMLEDDTVWLTQKLMAELFQTTIPNINMHLKSIYEEGELAENATIKDFLIVQKEGERDVSRIQKFYNLDAIISVGYRIKSHIATQFRIWATQRLKEYIIKGFALNDERFKTGQSMNYFNEFRNESVKSVSLSDFSIKRLKIFILPVSIMTQKMKRQYSFLKLSKTSCSGQSVNRRRQNWFIEGWTLPCHF